MNIDAEKLIAEIDKRLSIFEHGIAYDCWASCKKVVESLQQEQPEVDLEKALTGFMGRYAYENSGEYPSAIEIARHFYNLGLNARKEEEK